MAEIKKTKKTMETTKSTKMTNMMKRTPRLKIPMTTTIAPRMTTTATTTKETKKLD